MADKQPLPNTDGWKNRPVVDMPYVRCSRLALGMASHPAQTEVPMAHPCQISANSRIGALRGMAFSGQAGQATHLSGELSFDIEGGAAEARIGFASEPGELLTLDASFSAPPRRALLRLEIGPGGFLPGDVLGLVLQGGAAAETGIGVCLRATRGEEVADTRFDDRISLAPRESIGTALHTIDPADSVGGAADGFALILDLPTHDFSISLKDLHFFVIPAIFGLRSTPAQLSSFAA